MTTVFIIGAGAGGSALLDRLIQMEGLTVSGISDINPKAPGIIRASALGIPTHQGDFFDGLKDLKIDLVFDLTGNPAVHARITTLPNPNFHLVTSDCTLLLLNMIRNLEEKDLLMRTKYEEHRILTEISLAIALSKTSNQIFDAIVTGVMEITGMPAGSLSIYNAERKELFLVSAKGFSTDFYLSSRYPVREGGLSEQILSQKDPLTVPDIAQYPSFNNPIMVKEGVKSIIAIPLISDHGPIGILYADDFKPRTISSSIIEVLKFLAIQATIAIQKQQAFEQIKSLSILDPVTGLFNRRYFNEILVSEMDRSYRLNRPLSLILFDIDRFKGINDHYGHMTGDHVLRELTRLFRTILRRYDIFCRFGGDEMLILMSDTDIHGAEILGERLKEAVDAAKILPDGNSITCSFGVNGLDENESARLTPDEFLKRADQALYEAKSQGRDRVFVFHPALIKANSEMWQNHTRRTARSPRTDPAR